MNRNAHMIGSLSPLLEGEEKLLTPIYGTLVQKKRRWFGYFGLTEHHSWEKTAKQSNGARAFRWRCGTSP